METELSVLKFGGTSVGSGERMRRVAHIVAYTYNSVEEPFPVVVVSAMSGITDQLLRIARYACEDGSEELEQELVTLKQRHLEAVEKVVTRREARHALHNNLQEAFSLLERDVKVLKTARERGEEIALRTVAVAAWGERLSVLLVAAAVQECGVQAAPVCEEVIVTARPEGDAPAVGTVVGADPLMEETRRNAQGLIFPLIERRVVPVAAGFIGRMLDGYVTTLGRNGSDYSASVIGAALDGVEVTIYTDVDGVLTADPRLVPNARLLPVLSYAEAARLSWFGAKVLHPRTLIPVAPRNIPVRVRNTFRPHIRGTLVGPQEENSGATAITARRHLALITVESTDLFGAPENAGQVFALAARAGAAPVAICSSSGHHLSFMVEEQAAETVVALLQHDMGTWRVRARPGLAACACIGSGFTVDPMSPARAIASLARERIPVITEGASELGITLIVADENAERALRSLHRDLIAPVIPLVRHVPTVRERRRSTGAL